MSSTAFVLLICLAISALALALSTGWMAIAAKGACGLFCILFVLAAVAGRRFKFDPVLR